MRVLKRQQFSGQVAVGQWLSDRIGIPRQTLLSAADTGRLACVTCEDGTRLVSWQSVAAFIAAYRPKGQRK